MKIKQLSLFLENKPGHLLEITRTLARAGINITTLSLADTQQFGIVRLIIKEWEKAQRVLEDAGFVTNIRDVIAVSVSDTPGGLARLLEILSGVDVNIEYMYAFTTRCHGQAVLIFRFDDPDLAIKALQDAQCDPLTPNDIFCEN